MLLQRGRCDGAAATGPLQRGRCSRAAATALQWGRCNGAAAIMAAMGPQGLLQRGRCNGAATTGPLQRGRCYRVAMGLLQSGRCNKAPAGPCIGATLQTPEDWHRSLKAGSTSCWSPAGHAADIGRAAHAGRSWTATRFAVVALPPVRVGWSRCNHGTSSSATCACSAWNRRTACIGCAAPLPAAPRSGGANSDILRRQKAGSFCGPFCRPRRDRTLPLLS